MTTDQIEDKLVIPVPDVIRCYCYLTPTPYPIKVGWSPYQIYRPVCLLFIIYLFYFSISRDGENYYFLF